MIFRQGDVLIRKVSNIPAGASLAKTEKRRIVLAYGEQTGHAHAIALLDDVEVQEVEAYEKDGVTYLRCKAPAEVKHEEHATINLPAGDYQIFHQREYTPEEIRNVRD